MAKKTRKQKQRIAARRPAATAPPRPAGPSAIRPVTVATDAVDGAPAGAVETAWSEPASAGLSPAADAGRRRVGRIQPAAAPGTAAVRQQRAAIKSARFGTAAAMVEPLDSDDPAIPFDRVPYVPADLRRVAMIASVMVVLILIAWVIVTKVVD